LEVALQLCFEGREAPYQVFQDHLLGFFEESALRFQVKGQSGKARVCRGCEMAKGSLEFRRKVPSGI
jgi:hypothetical protein